MPERRFVETGTAECPDCGAEQDHYPDCHRNLIGYDWAPMHAALRAVGVERHRQEALRVAGKFAETCAAPAMDAGTKLAVLMEEVGEVAQAHLEACGQSFDLHDNALRDELIQVAAVAVAWVEAIDRDRAALNPGGGDAG